MAKNDVKIPEKDRKPMPFGRENYKWVLIGLAFLLVGFLLMIGGGSDNPDVENIYSSEGSIQFFAKKKLVRRELDEGMFSFRRLTLAPILILIGFGIQFYAIMKKPKE